MVACLALGRFRFHLPSPENTLIYSKTQKLWPRRMRWETFGFQVQVSFLPQASKDPGPGKAWEEGGAQEKGSLKAHLTGVQAQRPGRPQKKKCFSLP